MSPLPITKIDANTFDRFLSGRNPFEGGPCAFDLSEVAFISPSGMVQITAACHALSLNGQKPCITVADHSVRGYLLRSGFFSAVDGVATITPPLPRVLTAMSEYQRGTNPVLIEVTRIASGSGLPNLLDRIVSVLQHRLKYKKQDAFDIAVAISELSQNTFDHNAGSCGFLAMQVYGKGAKRFLEVAVADYGGGLTATLTRNPKYHDIRSDVQAIRRAIQPGVSEHDDPTRGTGLYHLVEITYRHQGSVQIRSGRGKVHFRMDKKVGYEFSVPLVPGVQVSLSLPAKGRS